MTSLLRRLSQLAVRGAGATALLLAGGAAWALCTNPTVGPDIIVASLYGTSLGNYVQGDPIDGKRSYAVGTKSLNVGDTNVYWESWNSKHPVIAQNLYRLKTDAQRPAGRFEQVGMSWLKHGFTALAQNEFCACNNPGTGTRLGTGCSDPYTSGLNGDQGNLGPRWQVDATTGTYAFPYDDSAPVDDVLDRRLVVPDADVDPALNAGARYFAEGQYVTADDATAGHGLNNASFREVIVSEPTSRAIAWGGPLGGTTTQQLPALAAWALIDPAVALIDLDTARHPVQRFHVARKVHDLGTGMWRHEYVIHNLNSSLSGRRFVVRLPAGTTVANAGFEDVDYHSGEPWSTADWTVDTAVADEVSWQTDTFATDPSANALRWATSYNFWFDATSDGEGAAYELELFAPGCPRRLPFTIPNDVLFADDFECGGLTSWTAGPL